MASADPRQGAYQHSAPTPCLATETPVFDKEGAAPTSAIGLSGKPRHERSGLPGLANASVSLPVVADVRLCVEQCKMYPRCSVVSVSSHSKQCLWFGTTKNVTCTATAIGGRVLDDFMSFSVRDHRAQL